MDNVPHLYDDGLKTGGPKAHAQESDILYSLMSEYVNISGYSLYLS